MSLDGAEAALELARLGPRGSKLRLGYNFVKACLLAAGGVALVLASLFGFQSSQGLLALRVEPRAWTLAQNTHQKWQIGDVVRIASAKFEPVATKPGYSMGWLRAHAGGDAILLWAEGESATTRHEFVVQRIDPDEQLVAPQRAFELMRPRREWSRLVVVRPFQVKIGSSIALCLVGLLISALAVWKARGAWHEFGERKDPRAPEATRIPRATAGPRRI